MDGVDWKGKSHKLLANASVLAELLAAKRALAAILTRKSIKALTVIRSEKIFFGVSYQPCQSNGKLFQQYLFLFTQQVRLTCGMVRNIRNKTRGSPQSTGFIQVFTFQRQTFLPNPFINGREIRTRFAGSRREIGWKTRGEEKYFFYLFDIFVETSPSRRKVSGAEIFCHVYKLDVKCRSQKVPTLTFSSSDPNWPFLATQNYLSLKALRHRFQCQWVNLLKFPPPPIKADFECSLPNNLPCKLNIKHSKLSF